MEVIGLVVIAVAVGMYYGFFDSVEVGARMAARKVEDIERDQKEEMIKRNANRSIDADTVAKAKEAMAAIDSIDL